MKEGGKENVTERDFKGIMQTEIGALAAEGKSDSRLCAALREVTAWMDSTAYQHRKKHYARAGGKEPDANPAEEQTKSRGMEKAEEEFQPVQGVWIRPFGETPKSYKWRCSACRNVVSYAPRGKKGTKPRCDYAVCLWCGAQMENRDGQEKEEE